MRWEENLNVLYIHYWHLTRNGLSSLQIPPNSFPWEEEVKILFKVSWQKLWNDKWWFLALVSLGCSINLICNKQSNLFYSLFFPLHVLIKKKIRILFVIHFYVDRMGSLQYYEWNKVFFLEEWTIISFIHSFMLLLISFSFLLCLLMYVFYKNIYYKLHDFLKSFCL